MRETDSLARRPDAARPAYVARPAAVAPVHAATARRAARAAASTAVEPTTDYLGQFGDDQIVGVVDHPPKLAVVDGTVTGNPRPLPAGRHTGRARRLAS